jgi:LPS sulfotransferase NodH
MTGYLILTTPRSGSNLLCDGLRRAGLGYPDEWLGTSRLRQWAEDRACPVDLPTDRADLVDYLSRVRAAQPGPFTGMKIHWHHVADALRRLLEDSR